MDERAMIKELSNFFYPKNIVVVGVSAEKNNLGKNIVMNCLKLGYQGEILSVGLKGGVVYGQRIYKSLEEIKSDIGLAVILTPSITIPGILEQCGKKGIRYVVIESGGFSEMGRKGRSIERACLEVADRYGIRFIGPNGIGVINMENGLAMPFVPIQQDLHPGSVSILAQSGGVGLSYLAFLAEENIGINKFVSIGNKLNVDENDLLSYLIEDEGTKIILIYLESFSDGRRFLEIASRSTKPILVHKSNRFKESAHIAHSHTAALSADDELVNFALKQAGCIRVNTMDEAMDYTKSLTMPPLKGKRLAVVSRSGGHAVIATDACAYYGFKLPSFPDSFLKKIEKRLRAHVIRLQNPLDLGDLFDLDFYEYIVEELLKRDDVDGILLGHGYRPKSPEQEASRKLVQRAAQLMERYQKPIGLFVFTESSEIEYLRRNSNIPIFSSPENAMRAFNLSYRWAFRRPIPIRPGRISGKDKKRATDILKKNEGKKAISLKDSLELIKSYGIYTVEHMIADGPEDAINIWRKFNSPIAMKINTPLFIHKSDEGALRLNLNSEKEIIEAFEKFQQIAGGRNIEVLIQPMIKEGTEIILGGKRDQVFGPVILFGLGGIFVEVLRDVVWRVAPVNRQEARRMINQIRAQKILKGIRGKGPLDTKALEDMIVRISHILIDLPEIEEIDINPIFLFQQGRGAKAVDARIILK